MLSQADDGRVRRTPAHSKPTVLREGAQCKGFGRGVGSSDDIPSAANSTKPVRRLQRRASTRRPCSSIPGGQRPQRIVLAELPMFLTGDSTLPAFCHALLFCDCWGATVKKLLRRKHLRRRSCQSHRTFHFVPRFIFPARIVYNMISAELELVVPIGDA